MNQLRHLFSVSANLTNRASLRASSISRSAGTDGNGSRSKNFFGPTNYGDNSADLKLTEKSYAKLILDYGREIEARNGTTKFNNRDLKRNRFFTKSPLQRFGRVPSLVRINNERNNSGSCFSRKSSSSPPPNFTIDGNIEKKKSNNVENIHDRSDKVDKNFSNDQDEGKYKAHPLVQRITKLKLAENVKSNESIDVNKKKISSVSKISEIPVNVIKNVSVIVEPRKKNKIEKNNSSIFDNEDNDTLLVTLTEESKFSSSSQSSLLQHVDLRINGIPATTANAVTSKVEKLDVIRSAEKIEIRIPVLSGATGGDTLLGATNSTISLYISSREKGATSSNHEDREKVSKSGNSGSGISTSSSLHSTSSLSKIDQNIEKKKLSDDLAKVVPWWTTAESFRQSEKIPFETNLKMTEKNSATKTVGVEKTGTRVNQEVNLVEPKKVTVSDAKMRFKTVVAIPSSPRDRFDSVRNSTSAIPEIIENKSRTMKIEQQRGEQKTRHWNLVKKSEINAKPEAKRDTKVKNNTSNETKKEALSSMPGKSLQGGTSTSDKIFEKMSPSSGSAVATSKKISKDNVEPRKEENKATTNNLSSANDSKFNTKPISKIGKGNTNTDVINGKTTSTRRLSNDVGSKIGTKPLGCQVASKSVTNDPSRLSRNCSKIKVLPCTKSLGNTVNLSKNDRCASIKPKDITGEKLSNVKNSTFKPIEKKKDGTLIDYGVMTVTTGKKLERKLSDSSSTDDVQRKKIMKQQESVVKATIKEVISKRNRNVRGNALYRNIENSTSKQNCPDKQRTNESHDHSAGLKKKSNKIPPAKRTSTEPKKSTTPKTSMIEEKRNSKHSNESFNAEVVNPDKKLLYSVWLGRLNEKNDQDPDPRKSNL